MSPFQRYALRANLFVNLLGHRPRDIVTRYCRRHRVPTNDNVAAAAAKVLLWHFNYVQNSLI